MKESEEKVPGKSESRPAVVDRRKFLQGAAAGGVATLAANAGALAAQPFAAPGPVPAAAVPAPAEGDAAPAVEVLTTDRPGSDFMVDVIKSLGFEYVAANPGSSFRGLHESLINYGGNKSPELITCCHEESSVAMAHGYAKVEGKPMLVMAHSTVGLQHASMGIYNAFAGRVPVFISPATPSTRRARRPASSGITARRTRPPWCGITPSGTICRFR